MATTNLKTYSGNRIIVELDGKAVGLIQSLSADDNYGLEDASGVGDIHVIEHVPSKANHVLSVSIMTLFTGNLHDTGLAPQNGDGALLGMVFDIAIYSKDTNAQLCKYTSCSYDSGRLDISAHRIVMQSGQFKALDRSGTAI